jgi:hypothetical protein
VYRPKGERQNTEEFRRITHKHAFCFLPFDALCCPRILPARWPSLDGPLDLMSSTISQNKLLYNQNNNKKKKNKTSEKRFLSFMKH